MAQSGTVISLEGIDASGKSTQIKLLVERLKADGVPVVVFRFPTYDRPIGKLIRTIITSGDSDMDSVGIQALEMLYVADQCDLQDEIERFKAEGYTVILDRYDLSTVVYYSTIPGMMLSDAIKTVYHQWQNVLKKPDMSILMDLPPGKVAERIIGKLDKWEGNLEAMAKASRNYRELFSILNDRTTMLVDASLSIDEISNIIYKGVIDFGKHRKCEADLHAD